MSSKVTEKSFLTPNIVAIETQIVKVDEFPKLNNPKAIFPSSLLACFSALHFFSPLAFKIVPPAPTQGSISLPVLLFSPAWLLSIAAKPPSSPSMIPGHVRFRVNGINMQS